MKTPITATQLATMKREAKQIARAGTITHSEALDQVARKAGYDSWHEVSMAAATARPPLPDIKITTGGGESVAQLPDGRRLVTPGEGEAAQEFLRSTVRSFQQDQLRTEKAHTEGIPALKRLFEVAQGNSGQCRHVAAFLVGLYNGQRFPFDLTDLRCVDLAIFEDCLRVLRMDFVPRREVHTYFENGSSRFEAMARRWSIADRSRLRSICEDIVERGVVSFGGEQALSGQIRHALANTFPDDE